MRAKYLLLLQLFLISVSSYSQHYTDFVNPFIGTANEGYTNPGATVPWGLSLSPLNCYKLQKEMKPSPYIYGEKNISGFSHFNPSGTGCPDMGIILLMPTTGDLQVKAESYWSEYSKEQASPGYYAVNLDRYKIKAELTTTQHTSISRYKFPKGRSNILVNLGLSLTDRKGAVMRRISDTEIEGYCMIGGICGQNSLQSIYFIAQVDKIPSSSGVWSEGGIFPDFHRDLAGNDIGAYFSFDTEEAEMISIKVGISSTSIQNAKANLEAEQPEFEFDIIRLAATQKWEKELSKIKVEGGTNDQKIMFYTALYHMLLHPTVFSDVNGDYLTYQKNKIARADGFDYYTLFSLWDTYRNVHPFLSLVYPQRQLDMVKTILTMYKDGGWLPKWELAGVENYIMVGDPAIPVVVDSWLRGIKGFDVNLAYQAISHNATAREADNQVRPGSDNLHKFGFIPEDEQNKSKVWGTVSTAQEYCIADWNLSQMAKALGKEDDYQLFYDRSMLYRNYFDPQTNFLRPRLADGSWYRPFNPSIKGGTLLSQPGFVEGNSWHYTFFVPHDVPGLIRQMGGKEKFTNKLATCFDSAYFVMGNEPDMAYPYLFNYVKGEEWRTQKYVRKMLFESFSNAPDGLPGNDDCGATSACLLFGMMGFYPDCPGSMDYQLASPLFNKITIELDPRFYTDKEFVIEAPNAGRDNCFIREMKLNGKPYKKYTINHQDIVKGGKLSFDLLQMKN